MSDEQFFNPVNKLDEAGTPLEPSEKYEEMLELLEEDEILVGYFISARHGLYLAPILDTESTFVQYLDLVERGDYIFENYYAVRKDNIPSSRSSVF